MKIQLEKFKHFINPTGPVASHISTWLKENSRSIPTSVDFGADINGSHAFITYIEDEADRRVADIQATEIFAPEYEMDLANAWLENDSTMDPEDAPMVAKQNSESFESKLNHWREENPNRVIISMTYNGCNTTGFFACLILHAERPKSQQVFYNDQGEFAHIDLDEQ